MTGANFSTVAIYLILAGLILGVLALNFAGWSRRAGFSLVGLAFGVGVALMALPILESVLLECIKEGRFLRVRQVLSQLDQLCPNSLETLWLCGGAVTGALMGILLAQWHGREKK